MEDVLWSYENKHPAVILSCTFQTPNTIRSMFTNVKTGQVHHEHQ